MHALTTRKASGYLLRYTFSCFIVTGSVMLGLLATVDSRYLRAWLDICRLPGSNLVTPRRRHSAFNQEVFPGRRQYANIRRMVQVLDGVVCSEPPASTDYWEGASRE